MAEPLYEVLGRNREFFVAHRATTLVLLGYVAVVSILLPGVVALCIAAASALNRPLGRALHLTTVAVLFAVIGSEILAKSAKLQGVPHVGAAVAVGVAGAWAYAALPLAGTFLSVLSVSIVAFPAIFLLEPSMAPFVRPTDRTAHAAAVLGPSRPPIVFAIFDQLPLTSIMAEDDTIDVSHYPGFAALAADSTWYRNATTVAELTNWAIPPLLSGMRPRVATVPSTEDYPDNLFTLLANGYHYEVEEPVTNLCPDRLCDANLAPWAGRLTEMLLDSTVVVLHIMAPADLEQSLPPLTQDWRNFVKARSFVPRWVNRRDADRRVAPLEWLEGISAADRQPTLYYLHALLPHEPYIYLRSGQYLIDDSHMPGLMQGGTWAEDPWPVTQVYQRHLLQVQYVDWLVGRLVARLKQEGLWDRALVIVTADHGVSFRPGEFFKEIDDATLPDIMSVPLFVKRPGQHGAAIDDRNVQSVDVVPTLADLLEVKLPWAADGRSILAGPAASSMKRIQFRLVQQSRDVETDELARLRRSAVQRKLTLFDPSDPDLVPRISVHRELIGHRLDGLSVVKESAATVELYHAKRFLTFDPAGDRVDLRLEGLVHDRQGNPVAAQLAIVVNGVVCATTKTYDADEWTDGGWRAFVSPRHFTKGVNDVQVFVIKEASGRMELQLASRTIS